MGGKEEFWNLANTFDKEQIEQTCYGTYSVLYICVSRDYFWQ